MRIALDAMGGDYAPATNIEGAIEAITEDRGLSIILVGNEAQIKDELDKRDCANLPFSIQQASQTVGMDESPLQALRRKRTLPYGWP
jgi:glycerol-3-phosphate acyltransferase PlsX